YSARGTPGVVSRTWYRALCARPFTPSYIVVRVDFTSSAYHVRGTPGVVRRTWDVDRGTSTVVRRPWYVDRGTEHVVHGAFTHCFMLHVLGCFHALFHACFVLWAFTRCIGWVGGWLEERGRGRVGARAR